MSTPRRTITTIATERLTEHPANIREDLGDLSEMARSIREHGILQPLTATEDTDHEGKLLLLAGHRRLGAAQLAGLASVPVIILHGVTDQSDHLVLMLVENTQRRDLSMTEIARRTGTIPSTVSYYLNLLMLNEYERQQVREGELPSTEAIAQVREARQDAREQAGLPLRGRPKDKAKSAAQYGAWFNPAHRLAGVVRAMCSHRGVRPRVGDIGCGLCWEAAIRDEPGSQGAREPGSQGAREPAVRRGRRTPTPRRRPESPHETPRPHRDRPPRTFGWSQRDIEHITGVRADRYVQRAEEAS